MTSTANSPPEKVRDSEPANQSEKLPKFLVTAISNVKEILDLRDWTY